jgi:hypothetical protein
VSSNQIATKIKKDFNRIQRERRKANGNAATKKYEKTRRGFLMRAYRNMKSRVTGIQKKKYYLYAGLPILDKAEFYNWSLNSIEFNILFDKWTELGYLRTKTPSVDRIDSTKGYIPGNIQWITHSENSAKTSRWA